MSSSKITIKNYIHKKYINKKENKKIIKNYTKIFNEVNFEIKNPKKNLNVLNKNFEFNFKSSDLKRFKNYKTVVVIGMGGSILGAEAIYYFLKKKIKKKFIFLNNLEEDKIVNLKRKKFSKILFIIISKSGNTIETLSNCFALNILKKKAKNIIIITQKKNNSLYALANKLNLFFIEHKSHIGGRFSVHSEVGVIPALLMGINIKKLRAEVDSYLSDKNKKVLQESAIKLANLINSKKVSNLIMLNYAPELEKFLYWCQQLIAESLGKKNKGFLPLISTAPKDHHSLLQLYLDGPKDKIFQIFSIEKNSKIKLNSRKNNYLKNKDITFIKNAQKKAMIKTLMKNNIPFKEIKIKSVDEKTLGKLFSFFILETVIIGKLAKIDPYTQPAVEQVKIFTKEFLN